MYKATVSRQPFWDVAKNVIVLLYLFENKPCLAVKFFYIEERKNGELELSQHPIKEKPELIGRFPRCSLQHTRISLPNLVLEVFEAWLTIPKFYR
jgi:hypothetical protein